MLTDERKMELYLMLKEIIIELLDREPQIKDGSVLRIHLAETIGTWEKPR